jgi:purine-binding chemotaxis protein CheW
MSENALRDAETAVDETLQWVTFHVDNEVYGVNVLQVQEVLKYTEITPVPGSPYYVLGIINLRGNVVTVIDTRARLGLPSKEVDDVTRIIFVEVHGHIIGMLVDCVTEVVSLRRSQIETQPSVNSEDSDSSKYVEGVFSTDDRILILVDVEKLFDDEEWSEAASF